LHNQLRSYCIKKERVQMKKPVLSDHLRFIIPSLLGVFVFMTPVKTSDGFTIPVAILADWIQDLLQDQLSFIMMVIIVITAIMTVIARVLGKDGFQKTPFFHNLFYVSPFWTITRVLAAVFSMMVFFEWGP